MDTSFSPAAALTQPALLTINEWLRDHRDQPAVRGELATILRAAPRLTTAIGQVAAGTLNDPFLSALDRLPSWADQALRTIVSDALEGTGRIWIQEVLEPLPEGVGHTVVEHFQTGDDHSLVVRIPTRLACQPVPDPA